MRILLVTPSYFPRLGGLETVVREIATVFNERGHSIHIVTDRYPHLLPHEDRVDSIQVTRFHFLYPEWQYLKSGRLDLWVAGAIFFPITLWRLWRLINRFRPEVVNLHYPNQQTLFLLLLGYVQSFRLVVSLHGGDVDAEPQRSRVKRWLFRTIINRADGITACSSALLLQARDLAPMADHKTVVIHNGVYVDLFANALPFEHPRPYILGVGRLASHKGFDVLIEAFAAVCNTHSEYDLLIAGEGDDRASLIRLVEAYGLQQRVQLLGPVDREQVASLMRGATLIAIPSRREPFGIVALEALASGRPIIATRIGGLVEALSDAHVTWVGAGNCAELHDAMIKTLEDNTAVLEAEQHNKLLSQSHTWVKVASAYLQVYADGKS